MSINYIDIGIIAVFLILTIIGYCRGILMTVINFIRYALGFSLCFFCSSNLAEPFYDAYVAPRVLSTINEKIVTTTNLDGVLTNLEEYKNSLPPLIATNLGTDQLTIPKADDIAQVILDDVFTPVLLPITKGAIFIVVFLLFFIATGLIIRVAKSVSKHNEKKRKEKGKGESPLKKSDRIAGGIFGIVKAAVIVLAITSILVFIADTNEASTSEFMTQLRDSSLVWSINEINPFNAITEGLI